MKDDASSSTAYVIARSTLYLGGDARVGHLLPARAVEMSGWFVRAHSRSAYWLLTTMRGFSRPVVAMVEGLSVPGIQLHYALRKRYLEDAACSALSTDGVRQMVVIGGGFDTLALRLHEEFPEVNFIEIDHPATQRVKLEAAAAHDLPRENLKFLSVDLIQKTLEESLLSFEAYRPDAETFFLCEGVTMYLTTEEIEKLFQFVCSHSGANSRLAFTFMESYDRQIRFKNSGAGLNAWLRLRSEPFTWGIAKDRLPDFLRQNGLEPAEIASADALRERYLVPHGLEHEALAEGECCCVARSLSGYSL